MGVVCPGGLGKHSAAPRRGCERVSTPLLLGVGRSATKESASVAF